MLILVLPAFLSTCSRRARSRRTSLNFVPSAFISSTYISPSLFGQLDEAARLEARDDQRAARFFLQRLRITDPRPARARTRPVPVSTMISGHANSASGRSRPAETGRPDDATPPSRFRDTDGHRRSAHRETPTSGISTVNVSTVRSRSARARDPPQRVRARSCRADRPPSAPVTTSSRITVARDETAASSRTR